MRDETSQKSAGDSGGIRGTRMQTTVLAGEIANYSIYQLKNKVEQVREMTQAEQDDVKDTIREAAIHILRQNTSASKGI
jgi:hypothetical protein